MSVPTVRNFLSLAREASQAEFDITKGCKGGYTFHSVISTRIYVPVETGEKVVDDLVVAA